MSVPYYIEYLAKVMDLAYNTAMKIPLNGPRKQGWGGEGCRAVDRGETAANGSSLRTLTNPGGPTLSNEKGGPEDKEERNGLEEAGESKEVSPAYLLTDDDLEDLYQERRKEGKE